ncbi:unnamed protein product, partial [Mesorhabditis spiculigera]
MSIAASPSICMGRKRTIATSPIVFSPTGVPAAKKSRTLKKPLNTFISFDQFKQMPLDIWLLLMNVLSPPELLNLAHSHSFFKELITKSPKRWGTLKECTKADLTYSLFSVEAKMYKLTRSGADWWPEEKYLLAYGDEYGFKRELDRGYPPYEGRRCHHVSPDVDREPPAVEDLQILLNNATFDQFGFGSGWPVPEAEKYEKAPYIRAQTAMLPIEGPKEELCRQIATTKPYCLAVHSSPGEAGGELRSTINDVVMLMPDLKKLWVHLGREICESECLVDVKMPTIVVYMALMKEVPGAKDDYYKTYEPDVALREQFYHTLVPTLQTMILQWAKRERDIDHVVVNALRTAAGEDTYITSDDCPEILRELRKLPDKLCEGHVDLHRILKQRGTCLIRREPFSNEGLLVTTQGSSIILITCGYTSHRHRTWLQYREQNNAADNMGQKMEAARERQFCDDRDWVVEERSVAMQRCETIANEWVNSDMYKATTTRDMFVDCMAYGYSRQRGSAWPYSPDHSGMRADPILSAYSDLFKNQKN